MPYDQIERVWVVHIAYSSIICVRSANCQVEIQDLFLPDAVAFRDLYQFLELKAQS